MDGLLLGVALIIGLAAGGGLVLWLLRGQGAPMKEQSRMEFENLANRIFEEKQKHFLHASQTQLTQTLQPMKEKLGEVQTKFQEALTQQAERQAALRAEIKMISESNKMMGEQADNLAKALKGDVKVQGDWGEVMLERILEASGLREGEDYTAQETFKDEEGRRLRPDVRVFLPQNRHIVIDAKTSLTDYERFVNAEEDDRDAHLQAFLGSIDRHIKSLAEKAYHRVGDNEGSNPDFVLMFMPIESAYHLAMQQKPELHEAAWKHNIVIASPATLFLSLRMIAQFRREERQNRNVMEIARLGGVLHDKIAGFFADLEKVGQQLDSARDTHVQAVKKLQTGRGNMLSLAGRLRELGAKTAKDLPEATDPELEDEHAEKNHG